MTEPEETAAAAQGPPADPIVEPYLERIDAALERHEADPATVLAEVETALADMRAALAPRRKTRRITAANKLLGTAREALRRRQPDGAALMREALEAHRLAHELPPRKPSRVRFGLAATLEDLPPPKTICRALEWDVGRPPMVIGPPGAAKTYAIQAGILDLMLGRGLWGCPDFRPPHPCRCLHVDLDQGRNKTLRRYQRLLRGLGVAARDEAEARRQLATIAGIDLGDLGRYDLDPGEGLALMSLQPEEIARWRATWIDAVRGYDCAFVDSLRRLAPFLDENDSRFSLVPDILRAISEAADVVIVLLHHASNKSAPRGGGPKPAPGTRGSSAIDGAAGTQLAIDKTKGGYPVTQIRAGEAAALESFFLVFENDEEAGAGGIRGVRLRYRTVEQVKAPEKDAKRGRLRAARDRALEWIRETNLRKGYGPLRKNVVQNVEGKDTALYAALDELVKEGLVLETKDGKLFRLWAADVSAAPST